MRQTLVTLPHEIGGVTLFGIGWVLLFWIGGCLLALYLMVRRQGWTDEVRGFLPFVGIIGLAIVFVLPRVEVEGGGLPIRGYGVMLLLATVAGLALAVWRARQVGLAADTVYNLAFNMFVGGILGARLFFVIQKWDVIHVPGSLIRTLGNIVNFVEGGLVIYGSLIGALIAAVWFLRKNQLPLLPVADLIAPSLALGLAIGRVGCLMNGCCFGGICGYAWAISFPASSPPYQEQHLAGLLYGFQLGQNESGLPIVVDVLPESPAAAAGLGVGEVVQSIGGHSVDELGTAQFYLSKMSDVVKLSTPVRSYSWSTGRLPPRSLPIHPTQIYSSINAALLALLAFAFFPFRRRDGQVFAGLMLCYAVTRFILEIIRTDEGAIWRTGLTISQNVSVVLLVGVVFLFGYIGSRPTGSYWPQPD